MEVQPWWKRLFYRVI